MDVKVIKDVEESDMVLSQIIDNEEGEKSSLLLHRETSRFSSSVITGDVR